VWARSWGFAGCGVWGVLLGEVFFVEEFLSRWRVRCIFGLFSCLSGTVLGCRGMCLGLWTWFGGVGGWIGVVCLVGFR